MESNHQIIKTREDYSPVCLQQDDANLSADEGVSFKLLSKVQCSWAKSEESFGPEKLRPRIEPWLTTLAQSDHLSLLIGSGLTRAVHKIATNEDLPGMSLTQFDVFNDEILREMQRIAESTGRKTGNFEDQIRAANDLLRGLEILQAGRKGGFPYDGKTSALLNALKNASKSFVDSILEGERNLISSPIRERNEAFSYLVSFLMSFASRSSTRERVNIFTTNYDRYIEAGCDIAGLRIIDRFVGVLAPVFRASRLDVDLHYNPPGIRGEPRYLEGVARFTKLHGSIDWVDYGGAIHRIGLPFGANDITPFLTALGLSKTNLRQLMVYPNAAKDRETTYHPYVELFRDLAATICRPNSTLVCYGYSFGDEHINRVIKDMLTIPSAHLVIISHGDPLGRIMDTYTNSGRHAQVTLLLGDHLGDLRTLVDRYLPKSAIDRTTYKMAELLKARWNSTRSEHSGDSETTANDQEQI